MTEQLQQFDTFEQWVSKASTWLTRHPHFDGDEWTRPGDNYRAICFDNKGRLCATGRDFQRARDEFAFPVRWVWPHQIGKIALRGRDASQNATVSEEQR